MQPKVFTIFSIDEIESHLEMAHQADFRPTLAIVFSAVRHNPVELCGAFAKRGIEVFGASSSGGFTHDGVSEGAIVVMLLDVRPGTFQVNMFDGSGKFASRLGRKVADWARECYQDPVFMVMSAGLQADGEEIVNGIVHGMGRQVPLFGGIAGIETGRKETFVFNATRILEDGVIALIFDGRAVVLSGVAASGWKGIGTPKTITRAQGNIVYEIDDAPALDMYNKYLNIGNDPTLAYEYPLLLMRDDGAHILRGSIRINTDKSIAYGGTVPQGAKVRFSIPPGLEVIDHAVARVSELHEIAPSADAVVLFSCMGRQFTLGPMVKDEIAAIHRLWNVPLVGFFTNGEIGPMPDGRCELHNHTLVPVVIRQR